MSTHTYEYPLYMQVSLIVYSNECPFKIIIVFVGYIFNLIMFPQHHIFLFYTLIIDDYSWFSKFYNINIFFVL